MLVAKGCCCLFDSLKNAASDCECYVFDNTGTTTIPNRSKRCNIPSLSVRLVDLA